MLCRAGPLALRLGKVSLHGNVTVGGLALRGIECLWRACRRSFPCQAGIPGQAGWGNDAESIRPKSWEPPWGSRRSWAWKQSCGQRHLSGLPDVRELPVLRVPIPALSFPRWLRASYLASLSLLPHLKSKVKMPAAKALVAWCGVAWRGRPRHTGGERTAARAIATCGLAACRLPCRLLAGVDKEADRRCVLSKVRWGPSGMACSPVAGPWTCERGSRLGPSPQSPPV